METTAAKTNIISALTRVFLFIELALLPLAVRNGYFDITEIKTLAFVLPTGAYLLGRLAVFLQTFEPGTRPGKLTPAERAAALLCAAALLSSLLSGFFWSSFTGVRGRWQGAGMLWLYAAVFFCLRGLPLRRNDVLVPLALGLSLSGALAVANHFGADPLGFLGRLREFDRGRYISTLGNINFAGAYFSLAVSAMAAALLWEERPARAAVWGSAAVIGLWAAMAGRSECTVLGLGCALALLPFTLGGEPTRLRRYGLLVTGTALAMGVYALLCAGHGLTLSALTRLLTRPTALVLLALAGLVFWALFRRTDAAGAKRRLRAYGLLLFALAAGAALVLWGLNTIWRTVPLGPLERWLRFSDSWGTDRLRVWKYCLELYGEFGPARKFLGGGCGVLARLDAARRIFPDAVLDAAHCEYLQLLLNWGLLGLGAYAAWLILAVKERAPGALPSAALAGLIGYGAQAAVNIAQAPGIMAFFLLAALLRCREEG